MNEDSETPFAFNPTENNELDEQSNPKSSFFENNKKLILIIAGGILAVVILTVISIIIYKAVNKGDGTSEDNKRKINPYPDPIPIPPAKTSDNYIIAKYEATEVPETSRIYTPIPLPPENINYTKYILSVVYLNISLSINEGSFRFKFKGNYTFNIYFNGDETFSTLGYFFFNCPNLVEVDFSHFKSQPIISMRGLFKGCVKLNKITYGDNFVPSNLLYITELFVGCESLKEIDLSKFSTAKLKEMDAVFEGCTQLKNINFGNIDTSNVLTMRNIFSKCSSLSSVNLENFNTEKVTTFENMFSGCSSMASIDVKQLETDKATDLSNMFEDCSELIFLNLNTFKTSNVNDMSNMFKGCTKLQSLDLSNFDTQNLLDMDNMFYNCQNLNTLDLKSFYTPNLEFMEGLFFGCSSLSSLDMSNFNTTLVTSSSEWISGVKSEGKIIYNPEIFTINLINKIPKGWEKEEI